MALALALLGSTLAPRPSVAQGWKVCAFNDQPIRCRDSHSPDGTVRIVNPANGNRIFVPLR